MGFNFCSTSQPTSNAIWIFVWGIEGERGNNCVTLFAARICSSFGWPDFCVCVSVFVYLCFIYIHFIHGERERRRIITHHLIAKLRSAGECLSFVIKPLWSSAIHFQLSFSGLFVFKRVNMDFYQETFNCMSVSMCMLKHACYCIEWNVLSTLMVWNGLMKINLKSNKFNSHGWQFSLL